VDVVLDGFGERSCLTYQRHGVISEVQEVVFDLGAPVWSKGVFPAAADRPARASGLP